MISLGHDTPDPLENRTSCVGLAGRVWTNRAEWIFSLLFPDRTGSDEGSDEQSHLTGVHDGGVFADVSFRLAVAENWEHQTEWTGLYHHVVGGEYGV